MRAYTRVILVPAGTNGDMRMNGMNQIILEGNVVRTPLVKDTPNGNRVCTLPIAVNRSYKGRDGSEINEVGYYDVEAWGEKLSNSIEKCGWKGRGVRVIGRLKQSRWRNNDGKAMSKIFIVAEHLEFKPARRKTDESADSANEALPIASRREDDVDAEIANLQEAASGLRAEQEAGEAVF